MGIEEGRPTPPEAEGAEKVFHFKDPHIQFEEGTRIVGMENLADVNKVVNWLVSHTVFSVDPDPTINKDLRNAVDFTGRIETRDRDRGFIGRSKGFEVKIVPTDVSIVKGKEADPASSRSFEFSRNIVSTALPTGSQRAVLLCTVSLTDRGIKTSERKHEVYDDETGELVKKALRTHYFSAAIHISPLDETPFDIISKKTKSTSSQLTVTHKSSGFFRK